MEEFSTENLNVEDKVIVVYNRGISRGSNEKLSIGTIIKKTPSGLVDVVYKRNFVLTKQRFRKDGRQKEDPGIYRLSDRIRYYNKVEGAEIERAERKRYLVDTIAGLEAKKLERLGVEELENIYKTIQEAQARE